MKKRESNEQSLEKRMNLVKSSERIVAPVNVTNEHWILVVAEMGKKCVQFCDSFLSGYNDKGVYYCETLF